MEIERGIDRFGGLERGNLEKEEKARAGLKVAHHAGGPGGGGGGGGAHMAVGVEGGLIVGGDWEARYSTVTTPWHGRVARFGGRCRMWDPGAREWRIDSFWLLGLEYGVHFRPPCASVLLRQNRQMQ